MKAEVLKEFKDKYTNKLYQKGEVITVSEERYAEILSVAPLVKAIKETEAAKPAKAKKAKKAE